MPFNNTDGENDGSHWSHLKVDCIKRSIHHLDSEGGNRKIAKQFSELANYQLLKVPVRRQNGSNCAMHVVENMIRSLNHQNFLMPFDGNNAHRNTIEWLQEGEILKKYLNFIFRLYIDIKTTRHLMNYFFLDLLVIVFPSDEPEPKGFYCFHLNNYIFFQLRRSNCRTWR